MTQVLHRLAMLTGAIPTIVKRRPGMHKPARGETYKRGWPATGLNYGANK